MRTRAVILGLFAVLALALVAPAALAAGDPPTVDPGVAVDRSAATPDWRHAVEVLANLRARPPRAPLILIMGNSTAREATISDASLRAAIERRSGRKVVVRNISSSNQAFARDAALVPFIPARHTIVFIGVDLVRFSHYSAPVTVRLPRPARLGAYRQHRYSVDDELSLDQKQALVTAWLKDDMPAFDTYYQGNLAELRRVIAACKRRGLRPVLLNTPRNVAVIGDAWSAPVDTYIAACIALAAEDDIPFVNIVGRCHFRGGDFYDLIHAVEPGRAKFQPLLGARAARLLARYFPAH